MLSSGNGWKNSDKVRTYVGVEKERVRAPRIRLGPSVEIVVRGSLREFTTMLRFEVLNVGSVFGFHVVDPCNTDGNYTASF
jgi:hypothetical protein